MSRLGGPSEYWRCKWAVWGAKILRRKWIVNLRGRHLKAASKLSNAPFMMVFCFLCVFFVFCLFAYSGLALFFVFGTLTPQDCENCPDVTLFTVGSLMRRVGFCFNGPIVIVNSCNGMLIALAKAERRWTGKKVNAPEVWQSSPTMNENMQTFKSRGQIAANFTKCQLSSESVCNGYWW